MVLNEYLPPTRSWRLSAPSHFHVHPFSGEVEARSDPLLDRTGNDDVAVETEGSRFPIRPDDTVLGEAEQIVVASGVIRTRVWTETQSGEQVDRPVAPSEIPPADFEEAARRKFEPLFGHSCVGGLLQPFDWLRDRRRIRCVVDGASSTVTRTSCLVEPACAISVICTRLNSPSAAMRRRLSMRSPRPSGRPGCSTISRAMTFSSVRTLPTIRTWSTSVCGPSVIRNVRSTRERSSASCADTSAVAVAKPRLRYSSRTASRS